MLPKMLNKKEVLSTVREKFLAENNNVQILEHIEYKNTVSSLPSFNAQSFILYAENNSFNVAQTDNLAIKKLTTSEFKAILGALPKPEQDKLLLISRSMEIETLMSKLKNI